MADKPPAKPASPKPAPSSSGALVSFREIIFAAILAFIIFSILRAFYSSDSAAPITEFFANVIHVLKIASTVISMIALIIIIFAYIRIEEISTEEKKKLGLALSWEGERTEKNQRWVRVEEYMSSLNPSDWKVGILEADNILDEITERMGYEGSTVGERMKNISASDFPYLEEAWEAHKIRNAIAHKGTDYELTRSDAEHVINLYYRIFSSLGYL